MKNIVLPIIICLAVVLGSTSIIYADSKTVIMDSDVTIEADQMAEQLTDPEEPDVTESSDEADPDKETALPEDEGTDAAEGVDIPDNVDDPEDPDVTESSEETDPDAVAALMDDKGTDAAHYGE